MVEEIKKFDKQQIQDVKDRSQEAVSKVRRDALKILSLLSSLGRLLEMGFSGLAPTVPLCILCREGELAEGESKGTDAARKPTRPSGTSSDLERECLNRSSWRNCSTTRGHLEEFYSSHFWY